MKNKETVSEIKEALKKLTDANDPRLKSWEADERKGVQAALKAWHKAYQKDLAVRADHDQKLTYERKLWKAGYSHVAGVDEVGRGPLAGPVVAAAVILPLDVELYGIDDSKKLNEDQREDFYHAIHEKALAVSVGVVDVDLIDALNILEASRLAMEMAVKDLEVAADYVLADAVDLPLAIPQKSLIQGDSRSLSIGAASIIAKVSRDRMMEDYDALYPGYGFAQHKGYGTKGHLDALKSLGPSPIHRRSFKPVQAFLN